ncbi:MAG: heat-inducible transcription repressor HrcA [Ignavibacteria bacterium GWA2_55_11]|nr:MAG: heat-inducible transcription repressor HrcA [Ignavibacteria bacterium GWA2_55_11]OGU70447.1 MAG: heat-inducible transcription repressor HrcA [Ignavibacteria bacterium RIFCSPLOWO2_02_FULL_55_14]OGU72567.1 MAG: heat-inducible transcription repressor HrcA [Ignavibacteria bacterium RIFCSPLOWO2_12_FULL_56_21]
MPENLSSREESVLRHVVYNFIQTAIPVGSRFISKRFESHLSPATIRNVMSDLEEAGFLSHPHTSAGRIPTDIGYRYYVDYLMEIEQLTQPDETTIKDQLAATSDPTELLRETSKLLAKISHQLSIVTAPQLNSGVFEKLELVPLSSSKILVIISFRSGVVRTIMLEVGAEVRRSVLDQIGRLLNERLAGLTLQQIRDSFADRFRDVKNETTGLIRLFIDSVDQLFTETRDREKLHIGGTANIIEQPEFVDPKKFRSVIELVENEEIIVHLLERHEDNTKNVVVTIGRENLDTAEEYSLMTATYDVKGVTGRVGIIGPKRMNYARMIPLVDFVAKTIANLLKH